MKFVIYIRKFMQGRKKINFKVTFSEQYHWTTKLKWTYFNQLSMPESSRNMFLHPIGHIRNDICGTIENIHCGLK